MASLPDLSDFATTPSDQFILDSTGLASVSRAQPFVGSLASCAHAGAHLHFGDTGSDYTVDVYAPVDAVVGRISTCLDLGNGNDKYEISLQFARSDGKPVSIDLSLEPMAGQLCESNKDFYKPYILVSEGETVTKGQLIARLLHKEGKGDGNHIHFHLSKASTNTHHCPNIFSTGIEARFEGAYGDAKCSGNDFGTAGFCYQPNSGEDLTGL